MWFCKSVDDCYVLKHRDCSNANCKVEIWNTKVQVGQLLKQSCSGKDVIYDGLFSCSSIVRGLEAGLILIQGRNVRIDACLFKAIVMLGSTSVDVNSMQGVFQLSGKWLLIRFYMSRTWMGVKTFDFNWWMEGIQCLEKSVVVDLFVYGALRFTRTGKCGCYIRVIAVVALQAKTCVVVLLICF